MDNKNLITKILEVMVLFGLQILGNTQLLLHQHFHCVLLVNVCFILLTQFFTDKVILFHSISVLFTSSPLTLLKCHIMSFVFNFTTANKPTEEKISAAES